MSEIEVRIKGAGSGRESAVNGLTGSGLRVTASKTTPPFPTTAAVPPSVAASDSPSRALEARPGFSFRPPPGKKAARPLSRGEACRCR